jgi:hypothetical protein
VHATDFWRDTVRRLDPRTLRVAETLHLKLPFFMVTSTRRDNAFLPEQVTVGDGAVWVASDRGALARADPHLRRLTAMLRLTFDAFQAIATTPGALGATARGHAVVERMKATIAATHAQVAGAPTPPVFVADGSTRPTRPATGSRRWSPWPAAAT